MPKRHRPGTTDTSRVRYLEELICATSGEDAFETAFALAARRILHTHTPRPDVRASMKSDLVRLGRAHPELGVRLPRGVTEAWLRRVDDALALAFEPGASSNANLACLDAMFETLVPRVAKGEKGQFFTPRHVVDFMIRALAPASRELVVDPSCGSGAFLSRARAEANVSTFGSDLDARAVRVARLCAMVQRRSPHDIVQADGLRPREGEKPPRAADVVATNPPFAGRVAPEGFELAHLVRTAERDALFLERSLELLRPGGRLGIVLPYNKAAGASFAGLRRWLGLRARIFAVVGLPRETFLPHTSQRTFVLFAKKRERGAAADPRERTLFAVSTRAGKDAAGAPVLRVHDGASVVDHDLDAVLATLEPFLGAEGFLH